MPLPAHPYDDDKLREECGVFGVFGLQEAANFVALGLHALQHRGQEAAGIVAYTPATGFSSARRFGYVRDNFTSPSLMETLPGALAIGHVRYSTSGSKGSTQIRDVQPLFAEFAMGGAAIAHNGNLTNAPQPARGADRARLDLPVGLGHRMHHPPDGALDPEDHPRADEGRAAPGRGRLLHRRDDPVEADRRPRPARRPAADARPPRRGLGAVLGDLRARHHRRRVRPRGRARRDGDLHRRRRRELLPVPAPQVAVLHLREGLLLPPRQRDRRPVGLRDPPPHRRRARPRGPGRGRSGLPGARQRHPGGHRLQPGERHPLCHGDHPQPVRRPHLHRAQPSRSATWGCG